jgi:hypothetical protein
MSNDPFAPMTWLRLREELHEDCELLSWTPMDALKAWKLGVNELRFRRERARSAKEKANE